METVTKEPVFIKKTELEAKAKEIKEKRALPEKPGDNVSSKELYAWLKLLTPDMTEDNRIILYIYRFDPVIIRQLDDPEADNNIDVISDGLDVLDDSYFIDRHGGGKYKITVKDQDKPKTQKGGFFEARLYIPMQQYPPKLNLNEVDWNHKNNKGYRAWAKSQGLIDDKNMPVIKETKVDNQQNGINSAETVQMMKLVMDFVSKQTEKDQLQLKRQLGADDNSLHKNVGDILLEKMKQDDPNKQVATLTTLLTAMKSMQPDKQSDNNLSVIMPIFMQMFQQMNDSANKQFTLLMSMINSKSEVGSEGKDEFDKMRSLLEIARELKGGGSSNKSAVGEIIEVAAPIVGQVLQIVGNVTAIRANQANGNTGPVPVKTTVQRNEPTPVHNPQPQQTNVEHPLMISQNEAEQYIRQFQPIILNKLGGKGWEFGAWIEEGFGEETAAAIVKFGADKLLEGARAIPEFWNRVMATRSEEYLKDWLSSFVNYKAIIEKMELENEEVEE